MLVLCSPEVYSEANIGIRGRLSNWNRRTGKIYEGKFKLAGLHESSTRDDCRLCDPHVKVVSVDALYHGGVIEAKVVPVYVERNCVQKN